MFLQNIRLRLNYMALQAQKTVVHESLSPWQPQVSDSSYSVVK
jgi:hypothetical protein